VEANVYQQDFNPTGSLALSALLAALPLITLLVLLGGLKWKAHWAGAAGLVVALAVAIIVYSMSVGQALDAAAFGAALSVLLILWITFNAIWIYNMTVDTGHFAVLRRAFAKVSDDQRVQAIVIAFSFGALIEALAGGGSPVAIASVMLVAIGFHPMKAVALALIANTAPVAFGGMGNPITVLGTVTTSAPEPYGAMAGRQVAFIALLVPFILVFIADGRRGLRQAWPIALVAGLTFGASQIIFSMVNYKLTDIAASLISAASVVLFSKIWQPVEKVSYLTTADSTVSTAAGGGDVVDPAYARRVRAPLGGGGDVLGADEPEGRGGAAVATGGPRNNGPADDRNIRDNPADVAKAFAPYAIIVLLFSLAQITPIKTELEKATQKFNWPGLHVVNPAGKAVAATYNLNILTAAGTLLFVSGLLTMIVLLINPARAARIYGRTLVQFNWAIATILMVFALSYVMNLSGMIVTLGQFLAGAGALFAFLSPIVGWFGVAVTGTDAGSNALMGKLQITAAAELKASPVLFGAANSSGGVMAKMISPQNLAIGTAAIGMVGQEGTLFRKVFGWSVALLLLLCVIVYLQSTPVLGWMVP
jgi:lactate permease